MDPVKCRSEFEIVSIHTHTEHCPCDAAFAVHRIDQFVLSTAFDYYPVFLSVSLNP